MFVSFADNCFVWFLVFAFCFCFCFCFCFLFFVFCFLFFFFSRHQCAWRRFRIEASLNKGWSVVWGSITKHWPTNRISTKTSSILLTRRWRSWPRSWRRRPISGKRSKRPRWPWRRSWGFLQAGTDGQGWRHHRIQGFIAFYWRLCRLLWWQVWGLPQAGQFRLPTLGFIQGHHGWPPVVNSYWRHHLWGDRQLHLVRARSKKWWCCPCSTCRGHAHHSFDPVHWSSSSCWKAPYSKPQRTFFQRWREPSSSGRPGPLSLAVYF